MRALGIESSCDETSAAVIDDDRILGESVVSQIDLHRVYGGVVPELASRQHLSAIEPVVTEALARAGVRPADLDVVCVTQGPGLVGALLVGLSFAKAFAWRHRLPWVPVNHLLGHVWANALWGWQPRFPVLALIVSGGHTDLVCLRGPAPDAVDVLGRTRDDAAGEAFDKVARMLDLPYPGGPAIERLAEAGRADAVALPAVGRLRGSLDMSFSGLKTAVYDRLRGSDPPAAADVAAAFQHTVAQELTARVVQAVALTGIDTVLLAGGVAANTALRSALDGAAAARGFRVHAPPTRLCTDNGAMVARAGIAAWDAGIRGSAGLEPVPILEQFRWRPPRPAAG